VTGQVFLDQSWHYCSPRHQKGWPGRGALARIGGWIKLCCRVPVTDDIMISSLLRVSRAADLLPRLMWLQLPESPQFPCPFCRTPVFGRAPAMQLRYVFLQVKEKIFRDCATSNDSRYQRSDRNMGHFMATLHRRLALKENTGRCMRYPIMAARRDSKRWRWTLMETGEKKKKES
jgi:hypothetical protein